jgi:Ser/Thr protein kinase RdoA (MazF antagonist)
MAGLPQHLASFAAENAGTTVTAIDRSWQRDNSNVWELISGSGSRFYLKQHPTSRFHEREVTAYRLWVPHLGPGRAPVLLAADASLRAIVITALPGQMARDLQGHHAETETHRQAGTLLRRMHEATPPGTADKGTDRIATRAEEHLVRARGLLEPREVRLLRDYAARLPEITRSLPVVPTHGDAQTRNFLWDAARQRLALIDFERAEPGPAVRDLVRLEYGPWDSKPHLRAAFLDGYGRQLTTAEESALQSLAALDALSAIQWGAANNDNDIMTRAYRTLDRLAAQAR